ncbi:MAG: hypothetical protein IJO65_01405 [Lachnospiraceae bacterium]|nr:hypothetical protein [Lachnospiraceae bacterium]
MQQKITCLLKKKINISQSDVSAFLMLFFTIIPTMGILVLQIRSDHILEENNNYRIYVITGIVFLTLLCMIGALCKRFAREIMMPQITVIFFWMMYGFLLYLLVKSYSNLLHVYPHLTTGLWVPWHSVSNKKVFGLFTIASAIGLFLVAWLGKRKRWVEIVRYPVYLGAAALGGIAVYCDNIMAEDILHGNTYYTSVYNAVMGAPFDYCNQSIYGHYAMFLKYPVKLLGGDMTAFSIVISFLGAFSIFAVALAMDLCVKNHVISMIGVWAIPVMFLYYKQNHWQMFPHRILFAGITLWLLALLFHKKHTWINVLGYVVGGMSFLWNVETGVVCLAVWALACMVKEITEQECGISFMLKCGIKNVAYTIATLFGALVCFNVYNISCGEQWHGFRFLLFPYIDSWNMPEILEVQAASISQTSEYLAMEKLQEWWEALNSTWISAMSLSPLPYKVSPFHLVILLLGIAVVLMEWAMIYKKASANCMVMGLAAIMALGHLIYYFNYVYYDYLAIAFFEAVLLLAIMADAEPIKQLRGFIVPYQKIAIAILSSLVLCTIWQGDFRLGTRIAEGYYDKSREEEVIQEIRNAVPEDTFAFGHGIQEIYAQLGWDTGCYVIDSASMGQTDSWSELIVQVSQHESCVVSIRNKYNREAITIDKFLSMLGVESNTISVKNYWDLRTDDIWSWDIYYVEINHNMENDI